MGMTFKAPYVSQIARRVQIMQGLQPEEDPLVEQAAEAQLEGEKEGENLLLNMLDWLGRPQSAVAGILHDLMDGGDFSPFDRVHRALIGKERYGVKNLIDIIAPGRWSGMKLPDWMGGKYIDPLKEGIGLVGDIFTDPLMALNIGGLIGKVNKFTPAEAAKVEKWASKNDLLSKRLKDAETKMQSQMHVASHAVGALANQRARARELATIWKEAAEAPEEFAKKYGGAGGKDELFEQVVEAGGVGRKWASPTAEEQFREGERVLLGVKTPFLMRLLGIPEGNKALIPIVDKKLGEMTAGMINSAMEGIYKTEVGARTRLAVRNLFQTSTGNLGADYELFTLAGHHLANVQEAEAITGDIAKLFRGLDADAVDRVRNFVTHPRDEWLRPRKVDADIAPVVEEYQKVTRWILEKERESKIWTKEIGQAVVNPQVAYKNMLKVLEHKEKMYPHMEKYVPQYASVDALKKGVEKSVRQSTDMYGEAFASNMDDLMEKVVRTDIDQAANWYKDTVPYGAETGYFPRMVTDEARQIFADLMGDSSLRYGDSTFEQVFLSSTKGRGFTEIGIEEINELYRSGVFPHDFMESFLSQARSNLKGVKRNKFMKMLGAVDPGQLQLFVEDPLQALALRIRASLRARSNTERINMLASFGRRIDPDDTAFAGKFGEATYLLSPDEMVEVLGKDWREKIGETGAKLYDSLIDRHRLENMQGINMFFSDARRLDSLALAHQAGVPVYALPMELAREIQKVKNFVDSPDEWRKWLRVTDEITNFWKATTLFPIPGYHTRNFIANFFQARLGGSLNPKEYMEAMHFMYATGAKNIGGKVTKQSLKFPVMAKEELAMLRPDGTLYTAHKQLDDMMKMGVLHGTFWQEEVLKASKSQVSVKKPFSISQVGKQLTHKGEPIKKLAHWATMADNWHRIAHYRTMIRKGKSPYEAAMSVKKYFFDYSELSVFEKNVMRRIFPFYTWTRKNIPLQLESMVTQPHKYADIGRVIEFLQSPEARDMDKKKLPSWIADNFGVPTHINRKTGNLEVSLLGSWLPAADLKPIITATPGESLLQLGTQLLHPVPKVAYEMMANKNMYTEKPIEEVPGEPDFFFGKPMPKKVIHLMKQVRLISEIEKAVSGRTTGGEVEVAERIMGGLGLVPKIKAFDIEQLERNWKYELGTRKGKLKRLLKKAEREGDPAYSKYIKNLLEEARGR